MNALAIGGVVFAVVFGGALLGMYLRAILPEHHLSTDSKDIIRISMAMIATLAALVVGLLIASAKSSFDTKNSELTSAAARYIVLDRTLAAYGRGDARLPRSAPPEHPDEAASDLAGGKSRDSSIPRRPARGPASKSSSAIF